MSASVAPSGRSRLRLKTLAIITPSGVDKIVDPDEVPVRLCNYLDVYRNERITADLPFMAGSATRREVERMSLRAGDVLVTKDSETPHDIGVPALVEASAAGTVCGYHLARLRPIRNRVTGRFLFWALKSRNVSSQFAVQAQGVTRFGLTLDGLGNARLLVPPSLEEQEAIANLLDASTAKLDAMRDSCREAMRLAHERSLAIAANAIAELAQDAPLVELRRVLRRVEQGWSPEAEERSAEDEEWAVLKLSAVKRGVFRPEEHKALPNGMEPRPAIEVRDGDLLVTRANTLETVADACVVRAAPPRLMMSDLIYRLTPDPRRADPDYLCLWLLSRHARQQIEADARGTSLSMVKVSQDLLRRWLVPLPEPSVQREVVARVRAAQGRSRSVMNDARTAIALLAERRAAIIEMVVSGRLDAPDGLLARTMELA